MSKRTARSAVKQPLMASGRSLLLDLPPELRDIIYAYSTDGRAFLNIRTKKLFSVTALARVNKQVRQEVNNLLYLACTNIRCKIRNLDFAPFVTFLNRLPSARFEMLRSRGITFTLLVDQHWEGETDTIRLFSWISQIVHPKKRLQHIDFEYKTVIPASSLAQSEWEYRMVAVSVLAPLLSNHEWLNTLLTHLHTQQMITTFQKRLDLYIVEADTVRQGAVRKVLSMLRSVQTAMKRQHGCSR